VVNFNGNAKGLVDLHQRVYDKLNEIKNLALIGEGDRSFVDRFLRFLLGHGELADYPNYDKANYNTARDNARMYVVFAVATLEDPDRIDTDRAKIIEAYFRRPKVRQWETDSHFGLEYLKEAGFFKA
jgi:hypothetical protein